MKVVKVKIENKTLTRVSASGNNYINSKLNTALLLLISGLGRFQ
jgi:hypothetical protein